MASSGLVVASAALLTADPAHAQPSTWINNLSNYRGTANWDTHVPPIAVGQSAIFANTGNTTINIAAPTISPDSWFFAANALNFTFAAATVNFSLGGLSGGIIDTANAGQTITIKNNIGQVSGVQAGVQLLGNSTLVLSGNNSYSGGTAIAAGTLQAGSSTALGTGFVFLAGGKLQAGANNLTLANDIGILGPGAIIDNNNQRLTLTGQIFDVSPNGGLTFSGGTSGLTIVSGSNNYAGGTLISGTTVQARNDSALGTGTVTLHDAQFQVGGVGGPFTVANNFSIDSTPFGSFIDNNGKALTLTGNITGDGAVTFVNSNVSGRTILLGTNTYTGGTTICACTIVQLGDTTNTASLFGAITNEGQFDIFRADTSAITSITNDGAGFGPATTTFKNDTTASAIQITNQNGGSTVFQNTSSAADATILNSGGITLFQNTSNAANATITNDNGGLIFLNASTAGNAKITNTNGGGTIFGQSLADTATAGTATIINEANSATAFFGKTSADHANITTGGSNASLLFWDRSTAGNATITTTDGGETAFIDNSNAGGARLINVGAGVTDFSQTTGPGGLHKITAGSIEGAGVFYIGAGNTLTVGSNNMSTTVDGVIADFNPCGCGPAGIGTLEKVGTGTMTLSGINTYSGGTIFTGGTVSVSQDSNLGTTVGGLTFNGGILRVTGTSLQSTLRAITWTSNGGGFDIADAANTFTVSQTIGNGGALTKLGPGTLVLSGANTYSGGTTIAGGTLSIGANNNVGTGSVSMLDGTTLRFTSSFLFDHNITVAGDPTFDVTAGNTTQIGGAIMDGATPGDVVKTGAGTLVLSGNNTYSGGTVISAGVLQSTNALTLGTGAVTLNGGTFQAGAGMQITNPFAINNSGGTINTNGNTLWLSSVISNGNGAGALTKTGTGVLLLTADNTYTGGTTISAGRLELGDGNATGSILGNVLNNGVLSFNRSNAVTFDGVVSGTGTLAQNGTGTTTLTGTGTYTGATNVNFGTLIVNGSIASSSGVTVASGATVGGTGTLSSTTVNSGGTLSPGNSIGTITIAGNLVIGAGGIYKVEVSPTTADRSNVTGNANIANGTLALVATGGTYNVGAKYTLLNATGGVTGTFAPGSYDGLFGNVLRPKVSYDANNVYLSFDVNPISPFLAPGATPNQRAVAGAIDGIFQSGQSNSLFLGLFNLTPMQLNAALNQLSGEVHASTAGVLLDDSLYVRSAILGRLRQASYGGNDAMSSLGAGGPQAFAGNDELNSALAYAKSPIVTKAPMMAPRPQSDVVFWAQGFGAWGRFNTDGNAATVRRDLAGFISGVDTRVGSDGRLGIAAGYSSSKNTLDARGNANVETGHIAGYGGWKFGAWNVRSGAALAFHTIDTDRSIAFPGFFDRPTAHYDGNTGQVFGEIGYGFAFNTVAVEPFAGAAWVRVATDATAERGGLAALNVAGTTFETSYSTLGLRAATMISISADMVLIPRGSLAWQHAFDSVTPAAVLAFQTAPGSPFTISGVPIARDSLLAEAGLDLAIGRNATIGVSYTGQLANNVKDHAAKGKFSWKF